MKNTKKLSSHSFFSLDLETKVERHTGSSSSTSQLRCGLCNTLFKNPVTTPCCGETFCYSCLLKALQQQLMLHRVEEQKQLYGALPSFGERGGIEGDTSHVKQEMRSITSESRGWRSRAGIAYDAVEREKKSRNFFLPHSNAHTGTVGPAFPVENRGVGGGSFAVSAATRKSVKGKGGLCPACGNALDLKDVVENVALRKCVDAIVLQSSPQEDTKVPSIPQQKKTLSQQSKHQQEQQLWQQQQQAQQQENRRLVKEQKGGGDESPPRRLQGQVKKEKEEQSSMVALKQEDQQKVKKEQHLQVQVHCKTETKEVFGSAAAARTDTANVPGNAADSGDSREEVSRAAGDSSVVSAARVSVVKTEAGATTSSSSATASVHLPPVSRSSSSGVAPFTDSNKYATDSVISLSSLVSDGEKIQHHEDAWACLSGAEAADAHKTSAAATIVVDAAAAPSRITDVTGSCAGLQSTVAQQQPDTTGVVATAAPTTTVSASTQFDIKSQEQGTGSRIITSSCGSTSSDDRGHSGGGSARSISSSTISGAHRANAAANGTSALPYSAGTAAANHVSGGAPPILPTASAPHHASGTSRFSVVNNNLSSCRSSSSEAVYDVVQGEYTDRSVVTNAATTDTGASGAQEQGDRASASKSGVLNDLDISQLQE